MINESESDGISWVLGEAYLLEAIKMCEICLCEWGQHIIIVQ